MAIASLVNVPISQAEFDTWSFYHLAHHRDVNNAIFRLSGVLIEEFVLDPVDRKDPGQWEDQHQLMHNGVNNLLGTGGFDLSSVDFTKPDQLAGWIQSNYDEHRQWADVLGID